MMIIAKMETNQNEKAHTLKTLLLISIALVLVAGVFGGTFLLFNKWRNESAKWVAMKEQIVEDNSLEGVCKM